MPQLIDSLPIEQDHAAVGIVEFAKGVRDTAYLTHNKQDVVKALGELKNASTMGCETHTGTGLMHAQLQLEQHGRCRVCPNMRPIPCTLTLCLSSLPNLHATSMDMHGDACAWYAGRTRLKWC